MYIGSDVSWTIDEWRLGIPLIPSISNIQRFHTFHFKILSFNSTWKFSINSLQSCKTRTWIYAVETCKFSMQIRMGPFSARGDKNSRPRRLSIVRNGEQTFPSVNRDVNKSKALLLVNAFTQLRKRSDNTQRPYVRVPEVCVCTSTPEVFQDCLFVELVWFPIRQSG